MSDSYDNRHAADSVEERAEHIRTYIRRANSYLEQARLAVLKHDFVKAAVAGERAAKYLSIVSKYPKDEIESAGAHHLW